MSPVRARTQKNNEQMGGAPCGIPVNNVLERRVPGLKAVKDGLEALQTIRLVFFWGPQLSLMRMHACSARPQLHTQKFCSKSGVDMARRKSVYVQALCG